VRKMYGVARRVRIVAASSSLNGEYFIAPRSIWQRMRAAAHRTQHLALGGGRQGDEHQNSDKRSIDINDNDAVWRSGGAPGAAPSPRACAPRMRYMLHSAAWYNEDVALGK